MQLNQEIRQLKPERLWHHFAEILEIPRPSKKEEKIAAYLVKFGKDLGLETLQDEIGNVLIRKPATPGMEDRKMVVLQSHIDMVCEKNSDVVHDFEKDPIISRIDGKWVKATGTTLGADDGIGIATQMAILEAGDIPHGPIECLFTVDEETGLTGAFELKPDFLDSKILLNLDSEDEGELFIGCAGGKDTVARLSFRKIEAPKDMEFIKVSLGGLTGGHSGDDIHKGRGNAVKLMNRVVYAALEDLDAELVSFQGGNLRNAIAREAVAVLGASREKADELIEKVNGFEKNFKQEYHVTEKGLWMKTEKAEDSSHIIDKADALRLTRSLYACPHGVIAWSQDIENFVETSTNLAAVKQDDSGFEITTSQRSSVESAKDDICNMVAATFRLAGAEVRHTGGYPGWTPDPDSEIAAITESIWEKLFDYKPKVIAIHAGLECGLIGEKYPEMDMISYGPTIKGAHSPDERLEVATVERFWDFTLEVLKQIPKE